VSFLEVPPDDRARLEQGFQVLQKAQQPEAPVIQIPVSAFLGSEPGGGPHRMWDAHR
jgi:hypothetical protein